MSKAGRPNLGKTATIRKRCVSVYLPTLEAVGKWKKKAAEADLSLSHWVIKMVDGPRCSLPSRRELLRTPRGREYLANFEKQRQKELNRILGGGR